MYVDLGGGSTEISVLSKSKVLDARSFKIGTLRLLNKNFQKKEWNELETWLNQFKKDFGQINIVGSGGNINKIAKLYSHREDDILPFADLEYAYKHLKSFTLHERVEQLGMRPDRADVIVPAARVFLFIAKIISADTIVVPKIGLADGLIIQLYRSYLEKGK
jgi:exopolyphosphatase/guanosine-5'-triphosphate,3'-diphosphate pyrophosphatase